MRATVIVATFTIAGVFPTLARATVIFNPVVGTGSFSLLPNGGFEVGLNGWSDVLGQSSGRGSFGTGGAVTIDGNGTAYSQPNFSFNSAGFTVGQVVSVTPGASYVLSGYIYAGGLTNSGDNARIDVEDVGNTTFFGGESAVAGNASLQFVYSNFTVPVSLNQVYVRLVRDGNVNGSERGYYDDIAVTPVDQFVAPSAPEPSSLALLGIAGLAVLRRRRQGQKRG